MSPHDPAVDPTRRETDESLTHDLQLDGPTVTVFGERDALDVALSDELARRGRSTHTVTTPLGWLTSVTHAVVRLDTASGERALQDLAARDQPATQVVAVGPNPADDAASMRLDDLCRQCGQDHEISVVWHPPLEHRSPTPGAVPTAHAVRQAAGLAAAIADVIDGQGDHASAPSYVNRIFEPDPSDASD